MRSTCRFNLIAVAALSLLAACGGGGSSSDDSSQGNPALGRQFNYGPAQSPTAAEQTTAEAAQTSLGSARSLGGTTVVDQALALTGFASLLADGSIGATPTAAAVKAAAGAARVVRQADTTACAITAPGSVTFQNCTSFTEGQPFILSGTLTYSAGSEVWDVTGTFASNQAGVSLNVAVHQAGNLTITSTKISGVATTDYSGSFSTQAQSYSFGQSTATVVDLAYQTTPTYCITSGSIEVKRVWTQRPPGATGAAFADSGIKLVWSGCDQVQVHHST